MATKPVVDVTANERKRNRVKAPKREGKPIEITNLSFVRAGHGRKKVLHVTWECPNGHGEQARYLNQCLTCHAPRQ